MSMNIEALTYPSNLVAGPVDVVTTTTTPPRSTKGEQARTLNGAFYIYLPSNRCKAVMVRISASLEMHEIFPTNAEIAAMLFPYCISPLPATGASGAAEYY